MPATLPFLISIRFLFNLLYLEKAYYYSQFWPFDPNTIKLKLRHHHHHRSSFPVLGLVANPMLVGLYMAGSVWSCDCGFLQPFLALQKRLGSKIIDISSNFRNEAITAMDSVPCANDEDALVDADFHASKVSQLDYTPILVSVLLAVLMIVVGYLLAFTFRSSIKEW